MSLTGEALEEYRELCDRCETKDGKRMPGTTNADWRRMTVLRNQLVLDDDSGAPTEPASLPAAELQGGEEPAEPEPPEAAMPPAKPKRNQPARAPAETEPTDQALEEIDDETMIQRTSRGCVIPWKIGSPVPPGYKAAVVNVGDKMVGRAYKQPEPEPEPEGEDTDDG